MRNSGQLFRRLGHLRAGCRIRGVAELLEIGAEQPGQMHGLPVIGCCVGPCQTRRQQRAVYARYGHGDLKAEQLIGAHADIIKVTVQCGAKQASCRGDVDTLAHPIAATGPAGVDQPG